MHTFLKSRYGFTMLPLILFMFVIVGLLSAGYMMLGPKVQLGKKVETKAGLEKTVDAIISWSMANNASRHRLPLSSELITVFGAAPIDAWGNQLVYVYDDNIANSILSTFGGICGVTTTSITQGATNIPVAFLILSRGNDNQLDSIPNTSGAYTGNLNSLSQADLFRIVTLEELKNRAGCYGSTQGRLKILNNELPNACAGSISYPALLYANGGVPGYSWSLIAPPAWITITPATGALAPVGSITATTGTYPLAVRVTDSQALTANSIQKTLNLKVVSCTPPPAAAWNFNEGSGNTIGSGSTLGTIAGTANWVPRAGGYSLFLDGTNNYIYFNDINYYNIGTGNVALSAWVNFSGMPKQSWCDPVSKVDMAIGAIAGKGFLYPAIGYGMYVTQTRQCTSCTSGCGAWSNYKVAFQLRNPANTDIHYVYSDDTISGSSWIHVVAMLDRSASPATDQIKMYLNGVKQTVTTNDYQYTAPTALNFDNSFKFTIGARHGGGSSYAFPYWGPIDDVQFYKVALTDAQVQTLYTTTALPYRIWNNSGISRWYTYYNGTSTTPCSTAPVASGTEFPPLTVKGTLSTYSNSTCTNNLLAVSYTNAIDTNGDNCLNINQTDRSCP